MRAVIALVQQKDKQFEEASKVVMVRTGRYLQQKKYQVKEKGK